MRVGLTIGGFLSCIDISDPCPLGDVFWLAMGQPDQLSISLDVDFWYAVSAFQLTSGLSGIFPGFGFPNSLPETIARWTRVEESRSGPREKIPPERAEILTYELGQL